MGGNPLSTPAAGQAVVNNHTALISLLIAFI
jgi:hypothetical protein